MRRAAYITKAKSQKGADNDTDESAKKKSELQLGSLHGILISTEGSSINPENDSSGGSADDCRYTLLKFTFTGLI